jgi:hypothetical protein
MLEQTTLWCFFVVLSSTLATFLKWSNNEIMKVIGLIIISLSLIILFRNLLEKQSFMFFALSFLLFIATHLIINKLKNIQKYFLKHQR